MKNNRQAANDRKIETVRKLVEERILGHEVFALAVRPKALTSVMFSRYEPGMHYGSHVDDALMQGMRTDVSFTLFLSDPESYDGGELVIESASGEDAVKLAAGSLVAYPSTALHHVRRVTRGERLAAVGWARSYVRDGAQREMLFDLDTARRQMFAARGQERRVRSRVEVAREFDADVGGGLTRRLRLDHDLRRRPARALALQLIAHARAAISR